MSKKKSQKKESKANEDFCPSCGLSMKEGSGKLGFPVNGEEILVPNMTFLKCPRCHEILLRLDESRKLREQAIGLYRKNHKLLSGEQIRSLRERSGLTQAELAALLRLGVNTLSRWESGRNVQTSAMDVLLRLIRDVPGTLNYLRGLAA